MEFKREIFFNKSKKIEKSEKNDFVFDIDNCDLRDERAQQYLEKLKEEDIASYYSILQQLSEKEILNKEEQKENDDYSKLSDISFVDLENDNPSEEYHKRFSRIKEERKAKDIKNKKKTIMIPFNPYK